MLFLPHSDSFSWGLKVYRDSIERGKAAFGKTSERFDAVTGAIRQFVSQPENSSELDARKIYKAARDAMQALCQARYEAFGSAGHASKIKAVSLNKMAKQYS